MKIIAQKVRVLHPTDIEGCDQAKTICGMWSFCLAYSLSFVAQICGKNRKKVDQKHVCVCVRFCRVSFGKLYRLAFHSFEDSFCALLTEVKESFFVFGQSTNQITARQEIFNFYHALARSECIQR